MKFSTFNSLRLESFAYVFVYVAWHLYSAHSQEKRQETKLIPFHLHDIYKFLLGCKIGYMDIINGHMEYMDIIKTMWE